MYLKNVLTNFSETGLDVRENNLTTAALAPMSSTGEFTEIVKKIILQGKPYSEENIFHMKRELGDIMWYMKQKLYGTRYYIR